MAFCNRLLENRKRGGRSLQRNAFVCGVPQSIRKIFGHPVQREVGREIVGWRFVRRSRFTIPLPGAPPVRIDMALARSSPSASIMRHRFGKRSGLHSADEVVDELHHGSAANRAQMQHIATQHRKHWARCIERLSRTSDEENQFARCRMRLGAGDGRIQESAAALGRFECKLANPVARLACCTRSGLSPATRPATLRFLPAKCPAKRRRRPPC